MNKPTLVRCAALAVVMAVLIAASTRLRAETGACGGASITLPFTDVPAANGFFCQIAAAYFSGLTNGTTATTYSPAQTVTREQMAAFITRTLDQSLKRNSRRAALGQWWTSQVPDQNLAVVVANNPASIVSDGEDLFVTSATSPVITRVRASDGIPIHSYTSIQFQSYQGILAAAGYIWVVGLAQDGLGYLRRFKFQDAGFTVNSIEVGAFPTGITFDGRHIWTANIGSAPNTGSISRISIDVSLATTFTTGFNRPMGILYDGANLWVTDRGDGSLKRVDTANGNVLETIPLGDSPQFLAFDGLNLWVPSYDDNSLSVVRAVGALRGTVLAQLTGNGLNHPHSAAFDSERILVTNNFGDSVSLWKAADLTPIGTFPLPASSIPAGVCSDSINFWVCLNGQNTIVRF
jgi:YVTN family beta-propeller protein